jgi:Bifunctional DNA primase/polymerase, N-terminal
MLNITAYPQDIRDDARLPIVPDDPFEAALFWHSRDLNVVPMDPIEKHPAGLWKHLQKQRVTENDLHRWRWKFRHGVGCITGAISNLIVLDTDGPEGEEVLREFERLHGPLPVTRTIRSGSGRGLHRHFAHPGHRVKTIAHRSIKLDVKGDGGFVVLPPTAHESGGRYELIGDMMEVAPWPTI